MDVIGTLCEFGELALSSVDAGVGGFELIGGCRTAAARRGRRGGCGFGSSGL